MRMMRKANIVSAALLASVVAGEPAWAFGGGGTAPGGPLSGGIRTACNGYDMDGTPSRVACDGLSVDQRRAAARRLEQTR